MKGCSVSLYVLIQVVKSTGDGYGGNSLPILGKIGEATAAWEVHSDEIPVPSIDLQKTTEEKRDDFIKIMGGLASAFLFF